ncbi:hypothetical protein R3I94_012107 [Phoxinus phoxinus]
MVRFW